MPWFVLARILFVAAVGYSAYQLHPVVGDPLPNLAFGLGVAGLVILLEIRLKETAVTNLLGALIGGAIGLAAAPDDRDGALLGKPQQRASRLPA